ncbi:DUF4352 domain-containing protein [Flexivirga alba]|uniref:DUF4352 domain-containing protein n=1 Tax=Flexivirga alba TaxID=702742 RepID=A0ABW2AE97_9MICO
MTQYNGPQDPTQWSGQPPQAGGPYPPVPPGPAPKKRNWFARHKILTGLFGLVAVIVIATAASSSGGSSDPQPTTAASQPTSATNDAAQHPAKQTAKQTTKKAAPKPATKSPGIGTPVKSGDLQFTVTKVVRDQTQVGQQYLTQKAQGRYTLVYVTVRNVGKESETLDDSEQKIKDADSKTYETDSMAELSMKNNDVWLQQINPGNAVDGILVYDMPAGVKATAIDFSGGFFEDAKTVQLS